MSVFASRGRSRSLIAAAAAVTAGALALAGAGPITGAAAAGTSQSGAATYLVVYRAGVSTSGAAKAVSDANGQIVANYSNIGVVIARSSDATFASTMRAAPGVEGASATAKFATRVDDGSNASSTTADPPAGNAPVSDHDSLSGLQWDMAQIHVPEAHAVTGGSSSVLVADIDTGLDFTHPDLAANYDAAASANCASGVPTPLAAGNDDNGHGTHTAGTIAAAANGLGIVGVAPGVRIAGVKAGVGLDGFFFPESVVCAYMWVAGTGAVVTNNSYFADPWLFNCKNDPEQRAIWTAERRALQFAQSKGVVFVAAEGNQADDLSHPTQDATSPDNTTPVLRDITNACAVVPVEVPGVVGVTATGNLQQKSFYSSYGVSSADIAAPGGDSILQRTAASPNGRVLSTWPANLLTATCLPARRVVDASGATYCYQQGTSMASPHAVGVAALIASVTGKQGGALATALQRAVNPIACPADTSPYDFFPAVDNGAPQTCTGGIGHNSWFGAGEVDALKAVS
ncbi:subtilase family protein [Humibacillus xanthopallidus]|uniref:Subtilase family protein n=1 Tax=Humibacillus xanthopallidus TaxID=412689 RepID=A0A543PR58_9MICO|nr:S8 family serine peptidase [Humibacillus xanthopallidus]TQN46558.1 subtilase family protein [Humibacillus xanthopallidus]